MDLSFTKVLLTGGFDGDDYVDVTWVFDWSTEEWSTKTWSKMSARHSDHGCWTAKNNSVTEAYISHGWNAEKDSAVTEAYDITEETWREVESAGHDPTVIRRSFGVGYISGRPTLLGGVKCALDADSGRTQCTKNGDVLILNQGLLWEKAGYNLTSARSSHIMITVPQSMKATCKPKT